MIPIPLFYILIAQADDGSGWPSFLERANPITLAIVGLAAIPMIFYMIRWSLKFQKEFMVYYIKENQELRENQDKLENQIREKDETIFSLQSELQTLKLTVGRHEFTIEDQRIKVRQHEKNLEHCEETIERLNSIIERRKLDRPASDSSTPERRRDSPPSGGPK